MTSLRSEPRRDGMVYCAYCTYVPYFTRIHTHARTHASRGLARETNFVSRAHVLRSRSSLWCERTTVKLFPGEIYIVRVRSGRKRRRYSIHDPLYSRLLDKANVKLVIQNSSQGLYNIFMNCLINFNSMFIEQILIKFYFLITHFASIYSFVIKFPSLISEKLFSIIYITWN